MIVARAFAAVNPPPVAAPQAIPANSSGALALLAVMLAALAFGTLRRR